MKLFSDCVGKCCTCRLADDLCLAGIVDNDYQGASKETIKERFFEDGRSSFRMDMINYLREELHLTDSEILELLATKDETSKKIPYQKPKILHSTFNRCYICKHNSGSMPCIKGVFLECEDNSLFEPVETEELIDRVEKLMEKKDN